jgi:hypothetical protein
MADYAAGLQRRDERAKALRQRQIGDQQTLERLRSRTDYVVEPGISGTREQSLQREPIADVQRMPVGEQIVRNPSLLERVIMPTPMTPVPKPKAVSQQPYVQKVQQPPLKNIPSTLYTKGLPSGTAVKKWPTSFKKAFHQPTSDERILKGLKNLDSMSASLLGPKRR